MSRLLQRLQIQSENPRDGEMKTYGFLDSLSTHFLICEEKIEEHGEDSGLEAINECAGVFGVFDGCGGLGAMSYPRMQNKTGAYLASRIVSAAVLAWFEEGCRSGAWDCNILKKWITEYMDFCAAGCGSTAVKIKGSMVRTLPTTIAAIVCSYGAGGLRMSHIWAGDSRTYILLPGGLVQISRDDVDGEDALSNLSNDGVLTNVVSADSAYTLHCRGLFKKGPCVVLAATDGCFGYLSSPMMFEYFLIDTMLCARNVREWRELLLHRIGECSGDDYTLSLAVFGYETFAHLQKDYELRRNTLAGILQQFEAADEEGKLVIWENYRKHYYAVGRPEVRSGRDEH